MKKYVEKVFKHYEENVGEYPTKMKNKVQICKRFKNYRDSSEYLNNLTNEYPIFKSIKDELPNITIKFKAGRAFNLAKNPRIEFHYLDKNKKGTTGNYCGITLDNSCVELWFGFGVDEFKSKKEKIKRKDLLIQKYKSLYGNQIEKGFEYVLLYADANVGSVLCKKYNLDNIDDKEFIEDIKYLLKLYINAENSNFEVNHEITNNIDTNDNKLYIKDKKLLGVNIIYKGYPGSGKSYEIDRKYLHNNDGERIDERCYERVTFYKEYTNAEFIGTIRPTVKQMQPTYEFIPGPFTVILKRAIENPNTNFYLIIEELNRGNAESIFGDVFQLLDRDKKTNESVYSITNSLIANYIYKNENVKIRIPNNLSIIASMNVSDENVQSIDTAFERRWDSIWILGETGKYDEKYIKGLDGIKWGEFRKIINDKIISQQGVLKNEDKQLGAYFINEDMTFENVTSDIIAREKFLYKVVLYLYNKICKYEKNLIFAEDIDSINILIKKFLTKDYISVFNQEIQSELRKINEKNSNK